MGTVMRLFDRLVSRLERALEPARTAPPHQVRPAEVQQWAQHQELFAQIPADARIFSTLEIPTSELAAHRKWLRRKYGPWGIARVWRRAVLGLFAVACALFLGFEAWEMLAGGQIASVLVASVVVLLVAFVAVAFEAASSRRARRGMRELCHFLQAEAALTQSAPVVEWLDGHWAWITPPKMLRYLDCHVRGTRRTHPFLLLSETEPTGDDTVGTPMRRTCVFIAAPGGSPRSLGVVLLPGQSLPARVVVTPAGLFGYWGSGSTFWEGPPEAWATVLDALLDLTDREIAMRATPKQVG